MLVLPRTSISTVSLAFISSSAACTCLSRALAVGAGFGILVLMTWAWLVKAISRWAGAARRLYAAGPVQLSVEDIADHRWRQQRRPVATVADAGADIGRRLQPF